MEKNSFILLINSINSKFTWKWETLNPENWEILNNIPKIPQ